MSGAEQIQWVQFLLIYLLLLIVMAIMHKAKINKTKMLLVSSVRMTVQLILAGMILTLIFENQNPAFTWLYMSAMTMFATHRVLSLNKHLNIRFKLIITASLIGAGLFVTLFLVAIVLRQNIGNPQYVIPLGGMIIGNAMTGITLGLNSFNMQLKMSKKKIHTLLALGVHPQKIMLPIVNTALEAALLPTMNSMIGMGIIFLPGMMTGQLLSGTLPQTAIMYQIAIVIAICTVTCLSVFSSLYFGYSTLYTKRLLFKNITGTKNIKDNKNITGTKNIKDNKDITDTKNMTNTKNMKDTI